MRGAVGGLNSDSDSDTDPPSGSSYQSQSLAQVHASPRHSSYGATAGGAAEVIITNELGQPGSPPSSLPSREGYECLDGAVGGQEISAACEAKEGPAGESSVEFFDDHFSGDNEMSGLISGGETSDSSKDSFLIKILGKKGTKRRRDDDDEAWEWDIYNMRKIVIPWVRVLYDSSSGACLITKIILGFFYSHSLSISNHIL